MSESLLSYFILAFCAFNLLKILHNFYKIRRDWFSFKISLSDDRFVKSQVKTPDIEIPIKHITKIIQMAGGVSVQSVEPQKFIFVPDTIEEYEDLLIRLNKICTIEVSPISSVALPVEYSLKQHLQPGSLLKKVLIGIGIGIGAMVGLFGVLLLVIIFLSNKH